MKVDHFFMIGKKHEEKGSPCEDYATSGNISTSHKYIILSDGCSGAKSRTDVGARLWTLALERSLLNMPSNSIYFSIDFIDDLLKEYTSKRVTNNIGDEYASLIALIASENHAQIWIMGDGGYALHLRNGNVILVEYKWEKNKPFYPIYKTLKYEAYNNLIENFKGFKNRPVKKIEREFSRTSGTFSVFNNLNMVRENIDYLSFEDFENGHSLLIDKEKEGVVAISLFTDGLWSVKNKSLNQTLNDVIIKNVEAEDFLKKSLVEVSSSWNKKGVMPLDDFSMGHLIW